MWCRLDAKGNDHEVREVAMSKLSPSYACGVVACLAMVGWLGAFGGSIVVAAEDIAKIDVPWSHFAPGKDAKGVNKLFSKRQKITECDLVFRKDYGDNIQPLMAGKFRVEKGWLKVYTKDGYVLYERNAKYLVNTETGRKQRSDLGGRALGITVFLEDPRSRSKIPPPVAYLIIDDSKQDYWRTELQTVPLPMRQERKTFVVRLKIEFSDDFEGDLGDWYVAKHK
jgi:hypothetical protein